MERTWWGKRDIYRYKKLKNGNTQNTYIEMVSSTMFIDTNHLDLDLFPK